MAGRSRGGCQGGRLPAFGWKEHADQRGAREDNCGGKHVDHYEDSCPLF